jgi:hypothetical protein
MIIGLDLGSPSTMGSFTRLRADDVKSKLDHILPSLVPFNSLQVLLLLATQ